MVAAIAIQNDTRKKGVLGQIVDQHVRDSRAPTLQ